MRLVAMIKDPRTVAPILTHLGLPGQPARADAAQAPPAAAANLSAQTPA